MANDKIKAGLEVLGNKKKFSRAMIVVIALCVTIVIIAGIGFYTGAISWHGGQLSGQGRIDIDGRQVFVSPYLGMGESTSTMFDYDSYMGIGTGALNIPLWGIELYPGQNIDFMPIPFLADQSVWGLTIAATETALSSGTAGATSFAY